MPRARAPSISARNTAAVSIPLSISDISTPSQVRSSDLTRAISSRSRAGLSGLGSSSSTRSSCWVARWAACTEPSIRSLTMVGRSGSIRIERVSIPRSAKISRSRAPLRSAPTTLSALTLAPSARKFAITKPALPGFSSRRCTRRIGIGASGEIRATSPHRYRSRITSPATNTRNGLSAGRPYSLRADSGRAEEGVLRPVMMRHLTPPRRPR